MAEETKTVEGSTILTAPPPAAPQTPEARLFKDTPTGEPTETTPAATAPPVDVQATPPAATPPAVPPATTPAATTEPKPPTEPQKPEATTTPAATPKDIDLKLPENSPLSAQDLADTVKEAKEAGLTQEQASKMLALKDRTARTAQTQLLANQEAAYKQTQATWKERVAKDPEMGGEKLAETVTLASRAFKTLASPELQVWAEKTGLGSYPEFVRLMAKVGSLMGEDRLVRGMNGDPPADTSTAEYKAEKLYGKTTPNK